MYGRLRDKVLPGLIPGNTRVLVAISGGPDSVALSHILWRYSHERNDEISLVLTHVNHMVRPEAEQEEELVLDLARRWEIPCLVNRFDSKLYAKLSNRSFQEAAREWRYSRWKEEMAQQNCQLLATAHHLGDQAETILYRLLRGTGTAGLAGIYPSKEGIIRPLLSVTKEEILEYCRQERLPFSIDRSNNVPVYDRNRIRLELLPELTREYNPRILQTLGRTAELLRWDEEYLESVVEKEWLRHCLLKTESKVCLNREIFSLPSAILSRLLRKAASIVSGDPRGIGFIYVDAIIQSRGKLGWMQNLPGILARIDKEGVWLIRSKQSRTDASEIWEDVNIFIPFENWKEIPDRGLAVGLFTQPVDPAFEDSVEVTVFADEGIRNSSEPLVLRTKRPGDKMWIKGVGHKNLKKVFQEEGIIGRKRDNFLIVAVGSEVLWLPGVKRGGLFNPSPDGKKMYCVIRPIK